jgi:hypothetical protein
MCEACRARDRLIRKNRRLREQGKLATANDNDIQTDDNAAVGGLAGENDEHEEDEEVSDHPAPAEPAVVASHDQGSTVNSPLGFMNLLKPADFAAAVQFPLSVL